MGEPDWALVLGAHLRDPIFFSRWPANSAEIKTCANGKRRLVDVRRKHPFYVHGWAVLPNHFHCLISLPEVDTDYSPRWRLIKSQFSKSIPKTETIDEVRLCRGERGVGRGDIECARSSLQTPLEKV